MKHTGNYNIARCHLFIRNLNHILFIKIINLFNSYHVSVIPKEGDVKRVIDIFNNNHNLSLLCIVTFNIKFYIIIFEIVLCFSLSDRLTLLLCN